MEQMPMISPSSDADWKRYYERKYNETDKQLKDLAWAFSRLLKSFSANKREDALVVSIAAARALQYPRDKDQILEELARWPEFAGSVLREEEGK